MGFQLMDRVAVEDEGDGPAVVCVQKVFRCSKRINCATLMLCPLMRRISSHHSARPAIPPASTHSTMLTKAKAAAEISGFRLRAPEAVSTREVFM